MIFGLDNNVFKKPDGFLYTLKPFINGKKVADFCIRKSTILFLNRKD